ncbi:hypothetical protein GCM10025786_15960 [Nocardioides caeni]
MRSGPGPARSGVVLALLLSLLLAAFGSTAGPAQAAPSPFPTAASVKDAVFGTGSWSARNWGAEGTIGGRPAACRSDQQMVAHRARGARSYYGATTGSVWMSSEVEVLRYRSVAEARQDLRRSGSYPRRCPRVTEWVCEECDGISTTWRTRVAVQRAGSESVGWSFKRVDNLKAVGYTMVARRGTTLVLVTLTLTRDVFGANGWVYPRLPRKAAIVRLARLAIRTAT